MNGRHPSQSDVLRSHTATVHLTKKLHCTACQRTTVQKKYDVWRCTEIGCAKPGQVECLAPVETIPPEPMPTVEFVKDSHGYTPKDTELAARRRLAKLPREQAFLSHLVERGEGCWTWKGYRMENGYGQFWHRGEVALAHRYSYELHNGPIPEGLFVCHRCDNPPCVNPAHLFLGTNDDNLKDSSRKGRMHPGEKTAQHKLTEAQVAEVRRRYTGERGQVTAIARELGVSPGCIDDVVKGRTWNHDSFGEMGPRAVGMLDQFMEEAAARRAAEFDIGGEG